MENYKSIVIRASEGDFLNRKFVPFIEIDSNFIEIDRNFIEIRLIIFTTLLILSISHFADKINNSLYDIYTRKL